MNYFMSLDPLALFRSMPGAFAQGMVWGLMALGVYITYRLLDFADLTVDGSLATGGAVAVMLIRGGMSPWAALIFAFLAGMAAGFITGILHTALGIPGILASILTQISLYSINLNIMGCSNQAVNVDKYPLVVSLRYLSDSNSTRVQIFATCILFCFAIVAILYWYFGTEQGHAIRATGCNQQMARAQGINTNLHTVIALMISNGLVGLSGGLYAQYQGAADVNMGRHRHRSCCCHYRRSYFRQTLRREESRFRLHAVFRNRRSDHLLYCNECGFMVKASFRRSEAFLRDRCGSFPCHSLSEIHTQRKGAVTPWQKC